MPENEIEIDKRFMEESMTTKTNDTAKTPAKNTEKPKAKPTIVVGKDEDGNTVYAAAGTRSARQITDQQKPKQK